MSEVQSTQFCLPDGRKKAVSLKVSDECHAKSETLRAEGFSFECEVLRTGHVSLTITDGESDMDIRIVPNGPGVREAVEDLILRFDPEAIAAFEEEDEPDPDALREARDERRDMAREDRANWGDEL